jgi:hypothetical protein
MQERKTLLKLGLKEKLAEKQQKKELKSWRADYKTQSKS